MDKHTFEVNGKGCRNTVTKEKKNFSECEKSKIQLIKFDDEIGFIRQFMNLAASHLAMSCRKLSCRKGKTFKGAKGAEKGH